MNLNKYLTKERLFTAIAVVEAVLIVFLVAPRLHCAWEKEQVLTECIGTCKKMLIDQPYMRTPAGPTCMENKTCYSTGDFVDYVNELANNLSGGEYGG